MRHALCILIVTTLMAATTAVPWHVCYVPESAADVAGWASVALSFDAERRLSVAGSPTATATLSILPAPPAGPDFIADHIRVIYSSHGAICDAFVGPSDTEATAGIRPLTRGRPLVSPGLGVVPSRGNASEGYVRIAHPEDEMARVALSSVCPTFSLRRVSVVAADTDVGAQLLAAAEESAALASPTIGVTGTLVSSADQATAFVSGVGTPGVFVLLEPGSAEFEALVREVVDSGSHREHVYVFVGSWCTDPAAGPFPGALCIDHALDAVQVSTLAAEFAARNTTFILETLTAAGIPAAAVTQLSSRLTETSRGAELVSVAAYALRRDAMAVLFAALRAADAATPPPVSRRVAAAAALPRVAVAGSSGPISFTVSGSRVGGSLGVINVLGPNNNATEFATVDVRTKNLTFVTPRKLLNWFNQTFALAPPAGALINSSSLHMCYIYQDFSVASQSAIQGRFMTHHHYADRFPLTFHVMPIADKDGSKNLAGIAAAVAERRDDCDMYLGPVTSFVSTSVTALIDKPWISESASSTELSDEDAHPWFSRVIPNDAQGGAAIAALLLHFNFMKIAILCTDEPYGRSVAEGVTTAFVTGGGNVAYRECMPIVASNETVDAAIAAAESEARVLVLATTVSTVTHFRIVDRLKARGVDQRMVLIFDEPAEGFNEIEGAFAIAVTQNRTQSDAYMSHLVAWAEQQDRLPMIHDAASPHPWEPDAPWMALMHDAVLFAMTAISAHATVHGLDPAPSVLQQILRNATPVEGFTGNVSLGPTGERVGAFFTYVNSADGRSVTFGRWVDTTGLERDESLPLSWLGGAIVSAEAPAIDAESDHASAFDVPPHVVAVALCAGILISVICFSVYKLRKLSPEAFGRAISSGTLFHAAKITFHFADLAADLTACYTVVSDDTISVTIRAFFAVLTCIAVVASFTELALLFRALSRSLRGVVLTIDEDARQQRRLEYGTLLTMCLEDIPMAVISFYIVLASSGPPDWVLTVTLAVSAFGSGMKASTVGPLLWHVWVSRKYEDGGQLGDEATREPLDPKLKLNLMDVLEGVEVSEGITPPPAAVAEAMATKAEEPKDAENGADDWTPNGSQNGGNGPPTPHRADGNGDEDEEEDAAVVHVASSSSHAPADQQLPSDAELRSRCEAVLARLKADPIDVESSQARIDFFAVFLEILLPQRYQLIKRAAERTAQALVGDNVSQNEFYAVLLPYLEVLFDRAGSSSDASAMDGGSSGGGHEAIIHFSAVEAMDVRREAQGAIVASNNTNSTMSMSTARRSGSVNPLLLPDDSMVPMRRNPTMSARMGKMVRAAMQRQRADVEEMLSAQATVLTGDDAADVSSAAAMRVTSSTSAPPSDPPSVGRVAGIVQLAHRWGHPTTTAGGGGGTRRRRVQQRQERQQQQASATVPEPTNDDDDKESSPARTAADACANAQQGDDEAASPAEDSAPSAP